MPLIALFVPTATSQCLLLSVCSAQRSSWSPPPVLSLSLPMITLLSLVPRIIITAILFPKLWLTSSELRSPRFAWPGLETRLPTSNTTKRSTRSSEHLFTNYTARRRWRPFFRALPTSCRCDTDSNWPFDFFLVSTPGPLTARRRLRK